MASIEQRHFFTTDFETNVIKTVSAYEQKQFWPTVDGWLTEPMKMCEQPLVKRVTFKPLQISQQLNSSERIFLRTMHHSICVRSVLSLFHCALSPKTFLRKQNIYWSSDWVRCLFLHFSCVFILWTHSILICIYVRPMSLKKPSNEICWCGVIRFYSSRWLSPQHYVMMFGDTG